jgi:hypothetical protein
VELYLHASVSLCPLDVLLGNIKFGNKYVLEIWQQKLSFVLNIYIYIYIYIYTGVGKSRFTVVPTEKGHAAYGYYSSFVDNGTVHLGTIS